MALNKVAVAVKSEDNSTNAVKWTLLNLVSESDVLTLIHVRPPVTHIPSPVGNLPISQVVPEVVAAHMQDLKSKTDCLFNHFVKLCRSRKVNVETVVLEADSVEKALVGEILKRGITKLILGATHRNVFTKKFLGPGVPAYLSKNAPDFCSVYVVSKQKLQSVKDCKTTLTRDDSVTSSSSVAQDRTHLSSVSSLGEIGVIKLNSGAPKESGTTLYESQPLPLPASSMLENCYVPLKSKSIAHASNSPPLPYNYQGSRWHNPSNQLKCVEQQTYNKVVDKLEASSHAERKPSSGVYHLKDHSSASASPNYWSTSSSSSSIVSDNDDKLEKQFWCFEQPSRPNEGSRTQVLGRDRAEHDAIVAAIEAKRIAAKNLQKATFQLEAFTALKSSQEREAREAQKLRDAQTEVYIARKVTEYESRRSLELKPKPIRHEEARVDQALEKSHQQYRFYTYDEILEATNHLSDDHKLGEGGYGVVYRGKLHHTRVAIKVLKEDAQQGLDEFQHEVEVLSRIHHPHVVLLLGCCPEKACLVYEFMANGSLQERLNCEGGTQPLPWFSRFRVAAEVATALFFLHSSKPEPIVHRDMKPANILLDQNLVSKIGDVGLASLIPEALASKNSTCFRDTTPVGTFAYIDPEYQHTGFFAPRSDVYAFGIVLLQLLTGSYPMGLIKNVKDSLDSQTFVNILDPSAGNWPLMEATKVAYLALECSKLKRKNRPDVASILPILDTIREFADDAVQGVIERPIVKNIPELFLCPILKELMVDPVIAADGYTYERAAIQRWFQAHDSSPISNSPLAHYILTPNFALRSSISKLMQGQISERMFAP